MRRSCALIIVLLAGPVLAGDRLRDLSYEPKPVEGRAGTRTSTTVLTVDDPGISLTRYAVTGKVRYREVEGQGYLEMWSYFPGGGAYFSRTLGVGTMAPLHGDSSWRAFALPFSTTDDGFPPPERLVLNVVLPGSGSVELDGLSLVQYEDNEDPTQPLGQWWDGSTAGLIGGIGGSVIGCLGALIGILASRGLARRFVLTTMRVLVLLGTISLAVGVHAWFIDQSWAVYYPLLFTGGIVVAVVGGLYPRTRARYSELELRRMQARDAAG